MAVLPTLQAIKMNLTLQQWSPGEKSWCMPRIPELLQPLQPSRAPSSWPGEGGCGQQGLGLTLATKKGANRKSNQSMHTQCPEPLLAASAAQPGLEAAQGVNMDAAGDPPDRAKKKG